ncbi:MAG: hypothetical protein D6726_06165 [Nitrospirae bacterium]|nr:MAG: hypothetical protein D6726_06165 [Nitrospirota bacterium]
MPKPIKKRVKKKSAPEEEVLSLYQRFADYYRENSRFVHMAAGALILVILVVIGGLYLFRSKTEKVATLESQGFRYYKNIYNEEMDEKERLGKALEFFEKAASVKERPFNLYYKALTEYKLGKKDESLKTLERIIKKFPDDREILPLAYYRASQLREEAGDTEGAIKYLKGLRDLKGSPFLKDVALYELARIYESSGSGEEAKRFYKELVSNYPESPYYKVALSKVEEKKEDKKGEGEKGKKDKPKKGTEKSTKKKPTQKKEGK